MSKYLGRSDKDIARLGADLRKWGIHDEAMADYSKKGRREFTKAERRGGKP